MPAGSILPVMPSRRQRGAGSGERGAGSGERGAGSGERGAGSGGAVVVSWPLDVPRRAWRRLRGGAVLAFVRLVDLVGALACPLAAGAGAVPGGVQLVGHLRP